MWSHILVSCWTLIHFETQRRQMFVLWVVQLLVILPLGKLDIGRTSKQALHNRSALALPLLDLLVLDLAARDLAVMVLWYVVAQLKRMCHWGQCFIHIWKSCCLVETTPRSFLYAGSFPRASRIFSVQPVPTNFGSIHSFAWSHDVREIYSDVTLSLPSYRLFRSHRFASQLSTCYPRCPNPSTSGDAIGKITSRSLYLISSVVVLIPIVVSGAFLSFERWSFSWSVAFRGIFQRDII